MKKTLIALAAVAATGAAFAQSTVTLSGTLDVGLEKRWSGDETKMVSNRNGTSNWTVKGEEDLGGGLKAMFQVSTSFNVDDGTAGALSTGTTGSALGNNGMFVGVTGGFGTLRAGRPVNTLYGNSMFANTTKGVSSHDSNSVLSGLIANAGNTVYANNAVQYHSPRFGGVQAQFEYAPSESAGSKAGVGIAVRYDGGPLSVSFTNYKGAGNFVAATVTPATPASGVANPKAVTQLAAAYDFGVAKAFFTYRDDSNKKADADTGYALGVTAPVGPGSLYASYNVIEQAGTDGKTIIAGYKYSLSKRTTAYVNVANRNAAYAGGTNGTVAKNGGNGAKSSNGFGVGLQHNF
jgi:predicted porin